MRKYCNPAIAAARCRSAILAIFILSSAALSSANLFAQEQAKPAKRTAVHAGKLIDVRTGKVTENAYVLIEGERIVSVGTIAPKDVTMIDMTGYTLLPGLIDAHGHTLDNPASQSPGDFLMTSAPTATIQGVHNLQVWLDHGFTAVRDACEPYPSYPQFSLRDGVAKGLIAGPRMVAAGSCISLTGGHGDSDYLSADKAPLYSPNLADTPDDINRVVRRDIKYGADWIKLMATGGVMDPISDYRVEELSEEQMARAVEVAHRAGKKVMAHAEGAAGIKAAVRAGVDSVEHGTMLDEEGAALMEQKGTWLVPTLYCFQHDLVTGTSRGRDPRSMAKGIAIVKAQGPAFKLALQHHLKIAYGVDDSQPEVLSGEFDALVRGGMTPLQALQAATINGATLLSLDKDMGTVEPGKFADLVAVPGDPLTDITTMEHVAWVMKGGTVVKPLNHVSQ